MSYKKTDGTKLAHTLWKKVGIASILLGLPTTVLFFYFVITGWPKMPYVTHNGPLWYVGDVYTLPLMVISFFLWLVSPMISLALGIYFTLKAKKGSIVLQYFILAMFQFFWGYLNLIFFFALAD